MLRRGQELEITKRRRVIARLLPIRASTSGHRPDFLARLRAIYGKRILATSAAELLREERARD
jgi:antitoxin (DNA-binding transcriptional repressor) of toxin-antitoxin stability system